MISLNPTIIEVKTQEQRSIVLFFIEQMTDIKWAQGQRPTKYSRFAPYLFVNDGRWAPKGGLCIIQGPITTLGEAPIMKTQEFLQTMALYKEI